MKAISLLVFIVILCLSTEILDAFQAFSIKSATLGRRLALQRQYLVPLDQFSRYTPTASPSIPNGYQIGLPEEDDLPDLSRFLVDVFGADAIHLSTDVNEFEKMLMTPAVQLVNGYSGLVAFAEVLAGLRSRLTYRLKEPNVSCPAIQNLERPEKIKVAAGSSVILVVSKPNKEDWHSDVIGTIELRLQPADAKIPFTLPWIDRIERKLARVLGLGKDASRDLQPYLSNLAVSAKYRSQGIGRELVCIVEDLALSWGYSSMYLHVDLDNASALKLYETLGYRDVKRRWNPIWAGNAADIGYFVKKLDQGAKKEIGVTEQVT